MFWTKGAERALDQLGITKPSALRQYGAPAAAGIGATGLLYALLRKQKLSADPILRALQRGSKGRLTALDYSASKSPGLNATLGNHPHKNMPEWLQKLIMKITRGVDDVKLHRLIESDLPQRERAVGNILRGNRRPPAVRRVTDVEGAVLNQAEPILQQRFRGDINLSGNYRDALRMGDKHHEAMILDKYMPGVGPAPIGTAGQLIPEELLGNSPEKQLAALTKSLKGTPGGYIIKARSGGNTGPSALLDEADDLTQLYRAQGPKGDMIRRVVSDPHAYVVQERIPLASEKLLPFTSYRQGGRTHVPIEFRTHVVNGRIVPDAVTRRYPTVGALNPFETRRMRKEIVDQLQPQLDKLPERYRNELTMALDTGRTTDGTWRIIETNPSGGQSGFMQPDMSGVPTLTPHRVYRAITGRESKPLAAAKALAGGGLAAGGVTLGAGTLSND